MFILLKEKGISSYLRLDFVSPISKAITATTATATIHRFALIQVVGLKGTSLSGLAVKNRLPHFSKILNANFIEIVFKR